MYYSLYTVFIEYFIVFVLANPRQSHALIRHGIQDNTCNTRPNTYEYMTLLAPRHLQIRRQHITQRRRIGSFCNAGRHNKRLFVDSSSRRGRPVGGGRA